MCTTIPKQHLRAIGNTSQRESRRLHDQKHAIYIANLSPFSIDTHASVSPVRTPVNSVNSVTPRLVSVSVQKGTLVVLHRYSMMSFVPADAETFKSAALPDNFLTLILVPVYAPWSADHINSWIYPAACV